MAPSDSPDPQSLPLSPSGYGVSGQCYDRSHHTTPTKEDRVDVKLVPLSSSRLFPFSSVGPDSSTHCPAAPSAQYRPEALCRRDDGGKSDWPHNTGPNPDMPGIPPPPPPPPGNRPRSTASIRRPPPPTSPPPPPPPPPRPKKNPRLNALGAPMLSSSHLSFSSESWRQGFTPSDSEASSDEIEEYLDDSEPDDVFDQQNRASFPPLMPTVHLTTAMGRDRRKMTNVITSKVSRLKHARSPVPSLDADASSVASTASSVDDAVQRLWIQMKGRRGQVNGIKQEMAGRRRNLREIRQRKDAADNAFMNMLRPILLRGQHNMLETLNATLDERFAEMQKLRTEYYTLESDYEGLEISLDEQEEYLNNIETRFFSLLAAESTGAARELDMEDSDDDEPEHQSNTPYDLMGISRNGPTEEAHPLWQDLVAAIGDLTNAQDEYEELSLIHNQYAYSINIKEAAGKTPSPDEIEFIKDYPEEESEKRENIERLAEEVQRLKQVCEENGAMKKHPSFRIAYALDPDIGEDMALDELWPESGSLAHRRFPDLLSCPNHVLRTPPLTALNDLRRAVRLPANHPSKKSQLQAAQKEFAISNLMIEFKGDDKSDFVTRWLLHQLRTSPVAVEILYATFVHEARLRIENLHRWQQDVLFYWWRDDAVKPREDFVGPTTESSMAKPFQGATQLTTALVDRSRPTSSPSYGAPMQGRGQGFRDTTA